jgi:phospholipase/lecithinase/hemolysin
MSNKHLLSSLLSSWSLSSRRKLALATVAAASVLAACGGDGEATGYERIIVFGDSLSDVGSYATPGVQSQRRRREDLG